jgi:hypothetical protein
MHFFLYQIVARIVAFYLLIDTVRDLRNGLAERKIRYWNSSLLNWSTWIADRDATPIQYWIQIGFRIVSLVACFLVTIFGWFQPTT